VLKYSTIGAPTAGYEQESFQGEVRYRGCSDMGLTDGADHASETGARMRATSLRCNSLE